MPCPPHSSPWRTAVSPQRLHSFACIHITRCRLRLPLAAEPGLDFYVVTRVPKGYAGGAFISWSITSAAGSGAGLPIATSGALTTVSNRNGIPGSGYNAISSGDAVFVERFCFPSAAAAAAPVTVQLSVASAAAGLYGGGVPSQATLMVISQGRCRLAPRFPLPYYTFPAAGGSTTDTVSALSGVTCDANTAKELEPRDIYTMYTYGVYKARAVVALV